MDRCNNCNEELEEVIKICYHCREPLCDSCHSDYGGMCEKCGELYE